VSLYEIARCTRAMSPVWQVHHIPTPPSASSRHVPQHDIRPFPGGMTHHLPCALVIQSWVDEVNGAAAMLRIGRPASAAGSASPPAHEFERVHPFIDGQADRSLLLNLVLVRVGYPRRRLRPRERSTSAHAARRHGRLWAMGEILARAIYDTQPVHRPSLAGRTPRAAHRAVDETFSLAALRQAAQRGRLDALQGSTGFWRSSRIAVDAYRLAKGQRRQGHD